MGLLILYSLCVMGSLKRTWHHLRCPRLLSFLLNKLATATQGPACKALGFQVAEHSQSQVRARIYLLKCTVSLDPLKG